MTERLGRYMVLKHLASGGMADVLLARTDGIEGFERHVVLKRIRAEHAKDQRFIDMFLDEARLAANLHHQNIVQVHDIGESDGEYFFAMEYLHGEDLRSMLSTIAKTRTHMPLGYVLSIVSAVAAGLHYAHERRGADKKPQNIVHRDVSPSNILVGYDGSVKIVDFGIAKAAMRQVETRSGSLKGKVSYMSPEQCKMADIDRRSDVYALGVVLYELATTTRLFKSDSDYLVMDAICTGKIPLPRVRRPDLPNELSTIIMTALATDPDRRYQTADELRVALDQFANKHSLTANPGAIAQYLSKLFGERPEPWLENTVAEARPAAYADTVANGDLGRRSWSELPVARAPTRTGAGTGGGDEAKTITDGKGKRPIVAQPAVESAAATKDPKVEDRTSTRMAWEQSNALPPAPVARRITPARIAMIGVPLLLLLGLGIWKVASGGSDAPAAAASGGAAAAPVVAAATPAIDPATPAPAAAPAAAGASPVAPAPAPVIPAETRDRTVAKTAPAPVKQEAPKVATAKTPAKVEVAKTPAPPAKAAATTPTKTTAAASKAAEPVKAVPPTPVVAAVAPPAPPAATPVPPPAPIEPQLAHLSQASVEGVASQHRKELSKCEGTDELHGEVSVKFEINATGRVAKSQVSSTLKNSKVSGCILRVIQGWQFTKPPSGAAEGSYTMSYQ